MAEMTTATKKVAKKAPAKKTTKKTASKKVTKKAPAKKPSSKRATTKKKAVTQDQFHALVREAAYFVAEQDGNQKDPATYWMDAEATLSNQYQVR